MTIVSNSSPLILFGKIGRLDLLRVAFSEVFIPEGVHFEVVTRGLSRSATEPSALAALAALEESWMIRRAASNPAFARQFPANLGRGEVEAIALALEAGSLDVLLDDRGGRRVARQYGLQVVGSAGVLVRAKAEGAIPAIRPLLDQLRSAGLYLSTAAYRELLARAGE